MDNPSKTLEWAKVLCIEAFKERGVVLREDDSIILVAAVFRKALDTWLMEGKVEIGAAANIVGDVMRKAIADEFKSQAVALRIALLTDAESASYAAEDAVKKALKMQGKDTHWKHRMEGVFIGVAVVLLGARLYGWFGK